MQLKNVFILILVWLGTYVSAQEVAFSGNPDTSFFTARELAFNGQRAQARDTLKKVLTKYPDYADIRSLLASTYSWDGEYEKARGHFNKITSVERKNKESWVGAIKNELYAKEHYLALGLANKALRYLPDDTDIIALKQRANKNTEQIAIEETQHSTAPISKKKIEEKKTKKNQFRFANTFEYYTTVFDPSLVSSLEYKRATKLGAIIPRINYSNRFNTNGVQFEIDAYPKFSKNYYAYLNYGYSNASIFPAHRAGAELYANRPKARELSVGVRYLDFVQEKVLVYTGSVGLYKGNYYYSLRPYVTPAVRRTALSGSLLARRYLKDASNYISAKLIIGFAPELKQFIRGDVLLAETILFVQTQQLLFD